MKSCSIEGPGYALAKRCVTSEEPSTFVDTNDGWVFSRTGIRARYISEEENTSDLSVRAVRTAIDESDTGPKETDLITTVTFTPDQTTPFTTCLIQEKLGLNNQHMVAFGLNTACSGFLYTLRSTHAMLAVEQMTRVFIIGAEIISKQLDWNDRSTYIISVNRARAVIVKQEDTDKRVLHFTGSMGDVAGVIHSDTPKPGPLFSEQPYQPSVVCMEGNATFRFAVKVMQETVGDALKQVGERIEDIDWIVPYQANTRIINSVCKHVRIGKEYVYINIEGYGNTSTASIPPVLGEVNEEGLLQPGIKIVLSELDTGFIWTGCYIEL